jgi:hypothetical protein
MLRLLILGTQHRQRDTSAIITDLSTIPAVVVRVTSPTRTV